MNRKRLIHLTVIAFLACSGCKQEHAHDEADHGGAHSHGDSGGHGHSHGDDAESFSGATHKEGTGITLLDETRKSLGIKTVEVREQKLSHEVRFAARVLDEAGDKTSGRHRATGMVPAAEAALLRTGMPAHFQTVSGVTATGKIQELLKPLANDETEVIVALDAATPAFPDGEFGEIKVSVPGEQSVLVVPREAVIRGSTGDLVYVVNGEAYLLTWVELGAASDGLIEITDGLLEGDSVVTRGVMDLWLVELRALKGGQGCCPAPPKKGKD